ncbi:hypothetical protein ACA910_010614 [Epithemia clementina (nom. ined.)]
MVQGLAFLSKKSWHVKNIANQEKVWLAEQREQHEKAKASELAKQIQQEREQEELNRMAGKKSAIIDRGIDWMYHGHEKESEIAQQDAAKQAEEYLLGKEYVPSTTLTTTAVGDLAVAAAEVDGSAGLASAVSLRSTASAAATTTHELRDRNPTNDLDRKMPSRKDDCNNSSDQPSHSQPPLPPTVAEMNEAFRMRHEDPMYAVTQATVQKRREVEQKRQLLERVTGQSVKLVQHQDTNGPTAAAVTKKDEERPRKRRRKHSDDDSHDSDHSSDDRRSKRKEERRERRSLRKHKKKKKKKSSKSRHHRDRDREDQSSVEGNHSSSDLDSASNFSEDDDRHDQRGSHRERDGHGHRHHRSEDKEMGRSETRTRRRRSASFDNPSHDGDKKDELHQSRDEMKHDASSASRRCRSNSRGRDHAKDKEAVEENALSRRRRYDDHGERYEEERHERRRDERGEDRHHHYTRRSHSDYHGRRRHSPSCHEESERYHDRHRPRREDEHAKMKRRPPPPNYNTDDRHDRFHSRQHDQDETARSHHANRSRHNDGVDHRNVSPYQPDNYQSSWHQTRQAKMEKQIEEYDEYGRLRVSREGVHDEKKPPEQPQKLAGYGLQGSGKTGHSHPSDLGPDRELLERKRQAREAERAERYASKSKRTQLTPEERAKALQAMEANAQQRFQKHMEDGVNTGGRGGNPDDEQQQPQPRGPTASFLNDVNRQVHGVWTSGERK